MNRVEAALRAIAADLDGLHIRWALVGGFAVSVRTEPRFTRDVDVAVAVGGDSAAEGLVRSLINVGYGLEAIVEQDSVGRLATARMLSPGADRLGVVVDVLFATAGIEPEVVAAAATLRQHYGAPLGETWPYQAEAGPDPGATDDRGWSPTENRLGHGL